MIGVRVEQRTEWDAAESSLVERIDPADEQDLTEVLAQLGLDEKPARVVAFLAAHGNGRSMEIEDACDLRQPEVSQATMELRDMGWVVAEPEKRPGKGRPVNNYHLTIGLDDIANEIEGTKREEINQELARLERLRQLLGLSDGA